MEYQGASTCELEKCLLDKEPKMRESIRQARSISVKKSDSLRCYFTTLPKRTTTKRQFHPTDTTIKPHQITHMDKHFLRKPARPPKPRISTGQRPKARKHKKTLLTHLLRRVQGVEAGVVVPASSTTASRMDQESQCGNDNPIIPMSLSSLH